MQLDVEIVAEVIFRLSLDVFLGQSVGEWDAFSRAVCDLQVVFLQLE